MRIRILIRLKSAILDPQGKSIEKSLQALGFSSIAHVRQGKIIELDIDESDPEKAKSIALDAANKLLVNEIMEDFEIVLCE